MLCENTTYRFPLLWSFIFVLRAEYFICISSSTGAPVYTWMIGWHFVLPSSSKIQYSRRSGMRVLLKVAEWGGKEHLFSIDANKTRTLISTVNLRHSRHLGSKPNYSGSTEFYCSGNRIFIRKFAHRLADDDNYHDKSAGKSSCFATNA